MLFEPRSAQPTVPPWEQEEAVAADFAAEPEKTMARLDITARAKNGEDVSGVAGPDGEQYASPSDSGAR